MKINGMCVCVSVVEAYIRLHEVCGLQYGFLFNKSSSIKTMCGVPCVERGTK